MAKKPITKRQKLLWLLFLWACGVLTIAVIAYGIRWVMGAL